MIKHLCAQLSTRGVGPSFTRQSIKLSHHPQNLALGRKHRFASSASQPSSTSKKDDSPGTLYVLGACVASAPLIALYYYFNNSSTKAEPLPTLSKTDFTPLKISSITPVTHDSKIFHLELPSPLPDPFPVAAFVLVKEPEPQIVRPYTPINSAQEKDHMDLLVKRYDNGQVSKYIHSLKVGDQLEVKGPIVKLPYQPNMKKEVGMIAGGTGITPMYQVINHILKNPEDSTKISLIYANISPNDILLRKELEKLAANHPDRFKVYYTVDKPPADESWNQGVGYVSPEMVKDRLPPPSNDVLVFVCGPPGMMNHVSGPKNKSAQGELQGLLKSLGYTESQVFKF